MTVALAADEASLDGEAREQRVRTVAATVHACFVQRELRGMRRTDGIVRELGIPTRVQASEGRGKVLYFDMKISQAPDTPVSPALLYFLAPERQDAIALSSATLVLPALTDAAQTLDP